MINELNTTTSFGSTFIPVKKGAKFPAKEIEEVSKFFELKGRLKLTPQEAADSIEFNQAAIIPDKNGIIFIGKDGGTGGADTFIGKILKKINPFAEFTDNIKPVKPEDSVFDLTV